MLLVLMSKACRTNRSSAQQLHVGEERQRKNLIKEMAINNFLRFICRQVQSTDVYHFLARSTGEHRSQRAAA